MHDFLQNERRALAVPDVDEALDYDEEWNALIAKHTSEILVPPQLPDKDDPYNVGCNSMKSREKKRLFNRHDIMLHVFFNYMASGNKLLGEEPPKSLQYWRFFFYELINSRGGAYVSK